MRRRGERDRPTTFSHPWLFDLGAQELQSTDILVCALERRETFNGVTDDAVEGGNVHSYGLSSFADPPHIPTMPHGKSMRSTGFPWVVRSFDNDQAVPLLRSNRIAWSCSKERAIEGSRTF
jgi:hypothetical protein